MSPSPSPRASTAVHGPARAVCGPTGEHRCVRAGRCVAADIDTQSDRRRGAATSLPDTVCDGCAERVVRALRELPRDYVALEAILGHHARAVEKVSGSPELPVPPRLDVLVAQADIDIELSTWAAPVAAELNIVWDVARMAAQRPGPRLTRAARLLAVNVVLLLRLGPVEVMGWTYGPVRTTRTGVEGALRLLDLHQRAQLLITGGPGDSRLSVPCPSCEGVLIRRNGADHVECQGCPRTWPEADYRRLCVILAEDYRRPA
ncbi:MAG TPA: hypothetical protein VFX53_05190 [Pedococcus sp.]|nr:hypothetical protein [Pedococcus sp.]